jgi:hypothetical protein
MIKLSKEWPLYTVLFLVIVAVGVFGFKLAEADEPVRVKPLTTKTAKTTGVVGNQAVSITTRTRGNTKTSMGVIGDKAVTSRTTTRNGKETTTALVGDQLIITTTRVEKEKD